MTNYGYLTDGHISWVCSVVQCLAVGGVSSEGAQAVQPREVSLSQLAALLSTVGVKMCVYLMTTISELLYDQIL